MDSSSELTVCLVEHYSAVRFHLAALLEAEGFPVLATFRTYRDALREFPVHHPRFGIIDNRLPDGSGIHLCRELSKICPDILLVLHASTLTTDEQHDAMEAGISAIVLKSLDLGQLFNTMQKLHES